MKEELLRKYRFSNAKLIVLINEKLSFATRDENEFINYGFSPTDRQALQDDCDAFENMPDDIELEADKIEAREEKDTARTDVEVATRRIMKRVENRFGLRSSKYRKFGTKGLTSQSDAELLKIGFRVERNAQTYLNDLTSQGLTQTMIDDYKITVDVFKNKLGVLEDKVGDRDIATEKRVEDGNDLYQRLMSLCGTGQTIWEEVSEARYNDYVVHNTPSGTNEPIEEEEEDDELGVES